jgi:hypothetical protein
LICADVAATWAQDDSRDNVAGLVRRGDPASAPVLGDMVISPKLLVGTVVCLATLVAPPAIDAMAAAVVPPNVCVAAGVTAPVATRVFGAGTVISSTSGGVGYCAVTPAGSAGDGFVEITLKPRRAFAGLAGYYGYQGPVTRTPGIPGAVWRRSGHVIDSVVFTAGGFAVAFANDMAEPPYPTISAYVALAAAIRSYLR